MNYELLKIQKNESLCFNLKICNIMVVATFFLYYIYLKLK